MTSFCPVVAHTARAYPDFYRFLGIFLFTPGWYTSPSQGYPPPHTSHISGTHLFSWAWLVPSRLICKNCKTRRMMGRLTTDSKDDWGRVTSWVEKGTTCIQHNDPCQGLNQDRLNPERLEVQRTSHVSQLSSSPKMLGTYCLKCLDYE